MLWTVGVSNPAGAACKAALCTCTQPMEPAARLELAPRAYETRAPPVVLRWHREPATGLEPVASGLQDRCAYLRRLAGMWCPRCESNAHVTRLSTLRLYQLGYEGVWLGAEDSNLHELLQRRASAAQVGAVGLTSSRIPASAGVRSPLRWLHGSHAATVLDQVFRPPRARGRTWSTVVAVAGQ